MRGATSTICTVVLALAAVTPLVNAVDVSSCAELAAVDRTTETEVTITTADFSCDEYTRLSIRSDMLLKSSVGALTFSNLGLKVYGSLTIEPDVVFTGIINADKSGAALFVQLGAAVEFQGTAEFIDISIKPREAVARIYRKGAAVFNKGNVTFEKDASFTRCVNYEQDGEGHYSASAGGGGAIYQIAKGTMHFMGKLTMIDNMAFNYVDAGSRAEGGAIYNKGDVIVDGEATFTTNGARDGGAIYQKRWGTFVFNGFATFYDNVCFNDSGGAIANIGGKIVMASGSLFDENTAKSNGDGGNGGAIYNFDGGEIVLEGSTSFTNQKANIGGAIFNQAIAPSWFDEDEQAAYKAPTITYPDDTLFEDNWANTCPDVSFGYGSGCA